MTRFKTYINVDEEQEFLNDMSKKGWKMKSFFAGFYNFERCKPGEWVYQVDIIDKKHGPYNKFCRFMEDIGVTVIQRWFYWVYLCKPASEGDFALYTDTESKIEQYTRMKDIFGFATVLEFFCVLIDFYVAIVTQKIIFAVFTVILGAAFCLLLRARWKCEHKIAMLRKGI